MTGEHHVTTSQQAAYSTRNTLTKDTKKVWLIFHGYGQLSRYFLRKFEGLDPKENYLIAPQGLSKFYLEGFSGRVGASWMTKEDRLTDIQNQHSYVDAVLAKEAIDWQNVELVYFGFSQGVATMCRYAAHARLAFSKMILWSGTFPPDLKKEHFDFLSGKEEVSYYSGKEDPFYQPGMKEEQLHQIKAATQLTARVIEFDGKHEVIPELVKGL